MPNKQIIQHVAVNNIKNFVSIPIHLTEDVFRYSSTTTFNEKDCIRGKNDQGDSELLVLYIHLSRIKVNDWNRCTDDLCSGKVCSTWRKMLIMCFPFTFDLTVFKVQIYASTKYKNLPEFNAVH